MTRRLQALRAFNEIDADGSGLLDRQEMLLLNTALDPSAEVSDDGFARIQLTCM